jgi:GR25 family glycosyltransferase involved in LPS biosynthesis
MQLLTDIFDRIYYINVDKHEERNTTFLKQFDKQLIKSGFVERIDAIKPSSTNVQSESNNWLTSLIDKNRKNEVNKPWAHKMTRNKIELRHLYELCCSLSHAKLIKHAIETFQQSSNDQMLFLVLEDDSVIQYEKLKKSLNDIIGLRLEEFDICYAGSTIFTNALSGWLSEREYHLSCSIDSTGQLLNANSGFFGTFGYIIKLTNANLNKFKELAEELSSGVIADFCLSSQPQLIKKAFHQFFVTVTKTTSTIDETYQDALNECISPDLYDLTMVHGHEKYGKNQHVFNRRNESAKQYWYFIEYFSGLKKHIYFNQNDENQPTKEKQLIEYIRSNEKMIRQAYVIRYEDTYRIWYGIKEYLIKQ